MEMKDLNQLVESMGGRVYRHLALSWQPASGFTFAVTSNNGAYIGHEYSGEVKRFCPKWQATTPEEFWLKQGEHLNGLREVDSFKGMNIDVRGIPKSSNSK